MEYPISLEVIKDSLAYVNKMVRNLGENPIVRTSNSKDGYLVTDDGNFILDVMFNFIDDFKKLNNSLNNITGIVGTSLFIMEVNRLIVAGENGIRVISKN